MNQNQTSPDASYEWESLLAKKFIPGIVEVEGNGPCGQIHQRDRLNRLWLAQVSVCPQSIVHTASHLGALPLKERSAVIAHVVVSGAGYIEQGGTRLPFDVGDISFRNLIEPSRVVFESPGIFYAIRLPITVLHSYNQDKVRRSRVAPRITSGEVSTVETTRALLSNIMTGHSSRITNFYLSLALPWLFAAAYHHEEILTQKANETNERRWQQILHYIEENLFDADALSPSKCAQVIGISQRYLYRLCAHRDLHFSRMVQERRLDTAHLMLKSTIYQRQTIASIAYQCGFKDPAHFSRLFKQRYGLSPRKYQSSAGKKLEF